MRKNKPSNQNKIAMLSKKGHICNYLLFSGFNHRTRKYIYICSICGSSTEQK
ncbi:hypothetical protein [Mesoplasma entomophilum]|uniref:hypothetical protein n=1 Tax=Mesoplasma entomophilum TaxID=2149 RepID=UPI0013E01AE1|nr:hypothetical protein [Mesoplasma entomophilum]